MANSNGICMYCNSIIPENALFCTNPNCQCMQILVPVAAKNRFEENAQSFDQRIDVITQSGFQGIEAYGEARKRGINPVKAAVVCGIAAGIFSQKDRISDSLVETSVWNFIQSQNSVNASDKDGSQAIDIIDSDASADSSGNSSDSSSDNTDDAYIEIIEANGSADSDQNATSDDYIMADSDSRYLDESDIQGLSSSEIQMIINEIYARHGRAFTSAENQAYFSSKSWYTCIEGKTDEQIYSEFNAYEKANVEFLNKYR